MGQSFLFSPDFSKVLYHKKANTLTSFDLDLWREDAAKIPVALRFKGGGVSRAQVIDGDSAALLRLSDLLPD